MLEKLAAKLGASIDVVDAAQWKHIRKYRAGDRASPERRNVLGVAAMARDVGAEVLVFVRDRDADASRGAEIDGAIPAAETINEIRVAGGVAIEEIEAWLLALLGQRGSEALSDAKAVLSKQGYDTLEQKLDIIDGCQLDRVPDDAGSLARWVERFRTAFEIGP